MKQHLKNPFVTTIDLKLAERLKKDLTQKEFEISVPPHTIFSAKKSGISCTLYQSGKLVVQGKESAQFIEFYLEPEILQTFTFNHPLAEIDRTPRIGIDESGKGDFFGALCVAGVYVSEEQFPKLIEIGVKDSKLMSDTAIKKMGNEIKKHFVYQIVRINPPKYNQIYAEFKNLNRLLAWGHATAIEQLHIRSHCKNVIIDQFADEWVVATALKRKNLQLHLTQRHRGEEDLVVAAASILARQAFLESLDQLSELIGIILPKGCSSAIKQVGLKVLNQFGEEKLRSICKQHFKTLDLILGKQRE